MPIIHRLIILFSVLGFAHTQAFAALPVRYTALLDYVQPAPDQGETNTCLFMAATGAIELLLNQRYGIKKPQPGGVFDLSERFAISYPYSDGSSDWRTGPVTKFNDGWAIRQKDLPFEAKTPEGEINYDVWNTPQDFWELPRTPIKDQFEEFPLFVRGGKYATYVLSREDLVTVKEALVKYQAPVLITYNDEDWWHTILIVGYDDDLHGECYFTPAKECSGKGAYYVRDSAGIPIEARDYDWFRVNGNAAFVVKFAE